MKNYKIVNIRENHELIFEAVEWFHQKWGIPKNAYLDSMKDCATHSIFSIPQWYVVLYEKKIVAGLGVIENDFHNRKDLSPNVCAVYVEQLHRKQGIAGEMLRHVCDDFKTNNIDTLYLVTDHETFYERYGWEFLCMAQGDGEEEMTRMYTHKCKD